MTSYEFITNRVDSPAIPGGTITVGSCTNISYGSVVAITPGKANVTRNYEPYGEVAVLYDPTKGRKFSALKKTGAILFSPYQKSLTKVTNSISSRYKETVSLYQLAADCGSTPPACYVGPLVTRKASWTENDDFSSLSARLPMNGRERSYYTQAVLDAISSTQQSAFNQALNAYDLLTELGELRETVGYLAGKVKGGADLLSKFAEKDPKAWREGRRSTAKTLMRSSDAALRKLGSRWMEYRYALMPLFYSFKDISSLIEDKAYRYQSERDKKTISLDYTALTGLLDEELYVESSGIITVRSLTKARFDAGDLQRLVSTVGLNPFRTAWELIPLSFVVDWLLNVGDAITSLTGIDYASERLGTTSVRESSKFTYTHTDRTKVDVLQAGRPSTNLCGVVRPRNEYHFDLKHRNVVRVVETESYSRTIWQRPTPKIIFDPYLNWKRFIDGLVLGYQPTKKILRSLR